MTQELQDREGIEELGINAVLNRLRDYVRAQLQDGASAPDLSFALAFVATELGLAISADPVRVFPVVLQGVTEAIAGHNKAGSASAGSNVPSRDLLEAAGALVELFGKDPNEPNFELRIGGTPFHGWAVDRAFADGGWRVLAIESHGDTPPDEDELDLVDVKKLFSQFESGAYA